MAVCVTLDLTIDTDKMEEFLPQSKAPRPKPAPTMGANHLIFGSTRTKPATYCFTRFGTRASIRKNTSNGAPKPE